MKNELRTAINSLKNGDKSQFDFIYNSTAKAVFGIAFSILRDRALCEDIMQNTYIKFLSSLENFNDQLNGFAWIMTIARNLAINEYNKRKREVHLSFDGEDTEQLVYDDLGDSEVIALMKKNLDEMEYQIVVMSVVCGYKRREIAKHFSLPLSTVTWKYLNALKKLKKQCEIEEIR